ncbi:quinol:electron acceptor oxidoreductase subunit ActD, partial [Acinetobacter baumannii]
TGALTMFALNGLPQPYHPVFDVPGFERASQDRFFLAIESKNPDYDEEKAIQFLKALKPVAVSVAWEEVSF